MSDLFQFLHWQNSIFFLLCILLGSVLYWGVRVKKKSLHAFYKKNISNNLLLQFQSQKVKAGLLLTSIFFIVLALMRPQGNPKPISIKKKGRDLIFVLDVSRSMLARDLKPNRLERAKEMIQDVVKSLRGGDRVGLVIFAGNTVLKSPLTHDYYYFNSALKKVQPSDIPKGGSLIGDAIRLVTTRVFQKKYQSFQDVILITDGEDHNSFPLEAAKAAKAKGIKIHTIGIGDPAGSNILVTNKNSKKWLTYKNKKVRTALNEKTLKQIAKITNGVFIPARTSLVDLSSIYQKYIAQNQKREMKAKKIKMWTEWFQFPLAIGILLLLFEFFFPSYLQFRKQR
ncbi:MAG: Ca-activated chloride channel family protein [bacterium]|jgi:Ca-activated chloride channel family protein